MKTKQDAVAVASQTASNEGPPQNGLAGLKHWRYDLPAALVVALVSIPLSLGIALASGAPPLCGLTSEVIAGLVFPFVGGAYVTISGPAAGLAPVLFTSITALGHGNMEQGYHRVLCVIMMVGFVQLLLTWMKAAKFSQVFPTAAIHGMLASIGFLLAAKQIPYFIGSQFHAHDFFAVVYEAPSELLHHLHPGVFSIGLICLLLLFQLSSRRFKMGILKAVPPQLTVVVIGAILGWLYHLDGAYLVQVPQDVLQHGFVFPDFQGLLSSLALLPQAAVFILVLTFVDGTESLATIQAVDRIDSFHRKSSPDRTLLAMGISNICSSLIGGLTIIPGIIKSSTNIVSGGRTAWVNFYNALFIITFVLLAGNVIRMIPVAALAAVLMHIGWKLAGPHKWRAMSKLGAAEMAVFCVTIMVTLKTDLLIGIAAGMVVELLVLLWYLGKSTSAGTGSLPGLSVLFTLLRSPLAGTETKDGTMHVYFQGAMHCFNTLAIRKLLDNVPVEVNKLILHLGPELRLIDHSMSAYLYVLRSDLIHSGKYVELEGLDELKACAKDETALRYRVVRTAAVPASIG